jgi:hypothetical protein
MAAAVTGMIARHDDRLDPGVRGQSDAFRDVFAQAGSAKATTAVGSQAFRFRGTGEEEESTPRSSLRARRSRAIR